MALVIIFFLWSTNSTFGQNVHDMLILESSKTSRPPSFFMDISVKLCLGMPSVRCLQRNHETSAFIYAQFTYKINAHAVHAKFTPEKISSVFSPRTQNKIKSNPGIKSKQNQMSNVRT